MEWIDGIEESVINGEKIISGLETLVVSMDGTTPSSFTDIRQGGNLLLLEGNIRTLNTLKTGTTAIFLFVFPQPNTSFRQQPDVLISFSIDLFDA